MEQPPGAPADLTITRPWTRPRLFSVLVLVALAAAACGDERDGQTLARVQATGRLVYGCDKEGGGPYAYPDPDDPDSVIGFEVELMERIGRELGARPEFAQGQWETLLQNLATRRADLVVNGYEWTPARARDYLATRPYYIFQLQLMAREDGPVRSWDDLLKPKPGGRRWRVGVLGNSAAETFAREHGGDHVDVVAYTGAVDAMLSVRNGQLDATLQDFPAVRFYTGQHAGVGPVGGLLGRGYYVMYVRKGDEPLRDALDRAIERLSREGELRRIYERYGIWTDLQEELATWTPERLPAAGRELERGWRLIRRYGAVLVAAALMTVFLSVVSMPLAMTLGLAVALGRMYGPKLLRWVLTGYIELIRGTPLLMQLLVLFYVLRLPATTAAIIGLAINYSAYEAEIYRAGLQAIPLGQMEAALALGMSRGQALRRIVVPQAVRIAIPPVTNDFIALFKDTSVCSVITVTELSKQYQIFAHSTGGVLEFAVATSLLYLAMSLPLSFLSRWSERRLDAELPKGGALA
jgi:polar amino acid transport system substrate-binding protein